MSFYFSVRDRVRTKMERDILAEVDHPFIVHLHYGELRHHQVLDPIAIVVGQAKTVTLRYMRNILLHA